MIEKPDLEAIPKTTFALILFLILLFFFMGLGGYDLTAPDEPRFGLVAQEMLSDHHWVLPHRNEAPYPDKPPFFFWTIAFFSALTGGTVTAWTARLPTAAGATLVLWIMWRWIRTQEKTNYVSFLTVLILMSCFKFFFQARIAQIDMVLCVFTTAALTTGYYALTNKSYSAFWLGIFMGIGILTKGPVGYLLPAGGMALFAAFSGRTAWKNYPVKALAWGLVPVILWLLLLFIDVAINNHWDYLNNLLFKQTLVRYFDAWGHHQPFYYFLVSLLYDFLPWTPFLILAIPFTRKAWQNLDSQQKYSWAVILFTLVFFSLSKGKRSIYILPAFPFAAHVTAAKIQSLFVKDRLSFLEKSAGLIAGLLIFILGLGLLVIIAGWREPPMGWVDAVLPSLKIGVGGGVLTVVSIFILVCVAKNRIKAMIAGIVISMAVVNILFFSVLLPWLDPYRSARGFTEEINQIISHHHEQTGKEPVLGMLGYRSAFRLYGNYPIVELTSEYEGSNLPTIKDFLNKYPQGWLIVRENDWDYFIKNHSFKAKIHMEQKIGSGRNFMLITQKNTPGE